MSSLGRIAIGRQIGPSGIVAADRQLGAPPDQREPLHHQRAVEPQHIDAVAQPRRAVAAIDQDIVAVAERRRHRIAGDADQRQAAPAGRAPPAAASRDRRRYGRSAARRRRTRPPRPRRADRAGHRNQPRPPAGSRGGAPSIASSTPKYRASSRRSASASRFGLPRLMILLHVGRVAPDQPRQAGESLAPLLDQRARARPASVSAIAPI